MQNSHTILVSGGAGYIGSCTALCLRDAGYKVVVLDNFSGGHHETSTALALPLIETDIGDTTQVRELCRKYKPSAVVHFAASTYVGESVTDPAKYYRNNCGASINFLSALKDEGVLKVVFSSTCATYGVAYPPISEKTPQNPINPYGQSKLMVEKVLADFDSAYNFKSIVFRYFNVAGAHSSFLVGERHNPETHLIPRAIFAAMGGAALQVFGTDYPTADGTCIRDYVHVQDIAHAHVLGLQYLLNGGDSDDFNIGTGRGHSIKEIINATESILGKKVPWSAFARREGDPPELVAASDKIKSILKWQPEYNDIKAIITTAVEWYRRHPELIQA